MKLAKWTAVVLVSASVIAPAFAKKDKNKADAPTATTTAAPAAADSSMPKSMEGQAAAIVAGQTITVDELDRAAATQLLKLRQQEYDIRMDILEGMVQQRLIDQEAAARKVSTADLLKTEVEDKAAAVTQDDIQQFYDRMKARMNGKTLDEVKGDIEKTLVMQKQNERRGQFVTELTAKANVQYLLDPPRTTVTLANDAPAIGPANAPITIVEWSDYQCPFCKRAHPTVEQVLSEYKDKIRFVYLDFPLSFHQRAWPASVAVHCAEDQGKFWEYHRNLFEANGDLSAADLNKRASDLGLDAAAFGACMDSKKFDAKIQSNFEGGQAVGVTGTPAFFINGRMLVGAQPIETFRQVINDELSRKGVTKTVAAAGTN